MKKLIVCMMISSCIIFGGCSSKSVSSNNNTKTLTAEEASKKMTENAIKTAAAATATEKSVKESNDKALDKNSSESNTTDNDTVTNSTNNTASSNTIDGNKLNYASGKPTHTKIEDNKLILYTSTGEKLKMPLETIDDFQRSLAVGYVRGTQTRLANLRKYVDAKKLTLGDGFSQMAAAEKSDIAVITNPEMTYVSAKYNKGYAKIVQAKTRLENMFSEPYSVTDAGKEYNDIVDIFKDACKELNITSVIF